MRMRALNSEQIYTEDKRVRCNLCAVVVEVQHSMPIMRKNATQLVHTQLKAINRFQIANQTHKPI